MWNSSTVMMIVEGTFATIYMTLLSTLMAYVIGLPVGVALVVTGREGLKPNAAVNKVLDVIVNITRSIPFLILLILVIPLTRAIVGKSYGPSATVVPLTLAAAPLLAEQGWTLEVTEFTDYIMPNEVVESEEIDANYFQHITYLESFNEERGTHLVSAGSIHYEPLGIYPGKQSDLSAITDLSLIHI